MIRITLVAVVLWGLPTVTCSAANILLRDATLESTLLDDAADGHVDQFDPLSASLIAGGVDTIDDVERYRATFLGQFPADLEVATTTPELVTTLFRALHEQLLTGRYELACTAPHRAIDEGNFNCVSATVLFRCLCLQYDVPVEIRATREHVFLRLLDDSMQPIETTCPEWFDQAGHGATEAHATGDPPRTLRFTQLLGKIYYNRALNALADERFFEAVELLENSLALDADDAPARENLLAAYNNWALAESRNCNYQHAVELLRRGAAIDSTYSPFLVNDRHIHQQWTLHLCRQERYAQALDLLDAAYQRRQDDPLFDLGRFVVCQQWAETLFRRQTPEDALRVLQSSRHRFAGDDRWPAYEAAAMRHAQETGSDLTSS